MEPVSICPVCGSKERELLHDELTDRVYFCAPGTWALYRCVHCRCGFLDPRPTPDTIELAYSNYCTHEVKQEAADGKLTIGRWVRRMLANGYRNHRFGMHLKPSSRLGVVLAYLSPKKRAVIEAESRQLLPARHGERVLDVGCGNGAFLDFARRIGWTALGVDFDPKAVGAARTLGLDIRFGGIEILDPAVEQFDGITLSHVIEHVRAPAELLGACYRLLKPGGWIWLETPNLDSTGYRDFGRNWLHLDPPRHLVLFTHSRLVQMMNDSGFINARDQLYRPTCAFSFGASELIARGERPLPPPLPTGELLRTVKKGDAAAWHDCERREYITVKAWKASFNKTVCEQDTSSL
jgi:SAM-dependent methyltransferase